MPHLPCAPLLPMALPQRVVTTKLSPTLVGGVARSVDGHRTMTDETEEVLSADAQRCGSGGRLATVAVLVGVEGVVRLAVRGVSWLLPLGGRRKGLRLL